MRFEKWQALGNDYLIIEEASLPWELSAARVARLCDPHFGVGVRRGAAALAQRGPRVRRRPADLQPGRLRGGALGQRRPGGDPLPPAQRVDRRRDLLDPHRRRADHPDDHLRSDLQGRDGPRVDGLEGLPVRRRRRRPARSSRVGASGASSTSRSATRSARSSSTRRSSRRSTSARSARGSKATSSSRTGPTSPSSRSTATGSGRGSSSAGWGRRSPPEPGPAAPR